MLKTIHVLLVLAALAILAYPVATAVDRAYGQDVYLLASVNSDDDVETNREIFEFSFDPSIDGDEEKLAQVLEIYGNVAKIETERVLVFDATRVTHPPELPELGWLPAGSAGGEYPLQTETVAYTTQRVTLAGFLAAVVLLLARIFLCRRRGVGEAGEVAPA